VFNRLKNWLASQQGVTLDFIQRPGVTYSLRASHANQKKRTSFVLVDVIEDDVRWLSICFFAEMTSDPGEMGDLVPQGLLGEDALCFDIDAYEEQTLQYIEERLAEACLAASLE
jgi:hypothetical protein